MELVVHRRRTSGDRSSLDDDPTNETETAAERWPMDGGRRNALAVRMGASEAKDMAAADRFMSSLSRAAVHLILILMVIMLFVVSFSYRHRHRHRRLWPTLPIYRHT